MKVRFCFLFLIVFMLTGSRFILAANYALNYTSNSYVKINSGANSVAGNYTIEAWFNLSSNSSNGIFGSSNGFRLTVTPGQVTVTTSLGSIITNVQYSTGSWNHVAFAAAGNTYTLYFNGTSIATGTLSNSTTLFGTNSSLRIGDNLTGAWFWGKMDELRIWNVTRSKEDIISNMGSELTGSESGLAAYYSFNEGSDTLVNDYSGHGLTGTMVKTNGSPSFVLSTAPFGQPFIFSRNSSNINFTNVTLTSVVLSYYHNVQVYFEWGTSTSYGNQSTVQNFTASSSPDTSIVNITDLSPSTTYYYRVVLIDSASTYYSSAGTFRTYSHTPGKALYFNGNNLMSVGHSPTLNFFTRSFTVEFWMKSTETQNKVIMEKATNYNTSVFYFFSWDGVYRIKFALYNSNYFAASTKDIFDDKWHHIAGVYDYAQQTVTLYIDGIFQSSMNNVSIPSQQPYNLSIGARATGQYGFIGSMDEIRIFNVARTQAQIRDYMNKSLDGTQGEVAYWQLDEASGTAYDEVNGNNATVTASRVTSSIPFGEEGKYISNQDPGSVGDDGESMTVSLTSAVNDANSVSIYKNGKMTDSTISSETFPNNITKRASLIWGIQEHGDVTADITLQYDNLSGYSNELQLKVIKRSDPFSPWEDVTSQFTQDEANNTFTGSGFTSFSEFAIAIDTNTPLPVELTSFTAVPGKYNVLLNWKTVTEINNYGFEIERRIKKSEITENPNWESAGFVKGNGNSNSEKLYQFTDNKISGGKYIYRLKQIDNDGLFKYSNEIEVEVDNIPLEFNLQQNYPNPFNPETVLKFTLQQDGFASLKIFNALGEEVAVLFNEYGESGKIHEVKFNASKLATGIYIARLQSGNNQMMKKMLLIK